MLGQLASYAVSGIVIGVVYAALALGYNIVYRVSKSINFAHPALVLLTAVTAYLAAVKAGLGLAAGALVAAAVGFAVGAAVERLVARPLRGRPPAALIAATLGVYYVLKGVSMYLGGGSVPQASLLNSSFRVAAGSVVLSASDLAALAAGAGVVALVAAVHRFTRLGVAMRAASEDAYGAAAYGIPVKALTMLSWGLAGAAGGLAAVAVALEANLSPVLEVYAIKALAASLLAGLDTVAGIIVGGLALGLSEQLVMFLEPYLRAAGLDLVGVHEAAAYLIMLLVLLAKPYGIFGTERIERV
ncbi:branched-chain amino acid ABC transporter permease [Pyrodictium occultum]|uniref:branched-chain amino acid ABC transporter permease n=1 Tax=Pyrodictium occultum TaxID=2309 RepID=UPI001F4012D1|nr:branched-chain amino acid ABC transporter permease [Pyrodictium occultum]